MSTATASGENPNVDAGRPKHLRDGYPNLFRSRFPNGAEHSVRAATHRRGQLEFQHPPD